MVKTILLIFLISKIDLWDIIRLSCVSVIIVHSILEILPQCYSRPHFVPGPLINPPTPFQVHHFVTASFNMLKVNFIHNQIQHEVGHTSSPHCTHIEGTVSHAEQSVAFRFQNFLVSKLFHIFGWYRIRYRKNLVSKKYRIRYWKKIGIEESIWFRIEKSWYTKVSDSVLEIFGIKILDLFV